VARSAGLPRPNSGFGAEAGAQHASGAAWTGRVALRSGGKASQRCR